MKSDLMFPKVKTKKKRKSHPASIIQEHDGTCFLCSMAGDRSCKYTHSHHIFFGNPGRSLSEEYGLKVDLCIYHHEEGKKAVHKNAQINAYLKMIGQQAFEEKYGHKKFISVFGKNYVDEMDVPDFSLGCYL